MVAGVLALALVSAQAGIAGKVAGGIRVWLFGGKAAVNVRSFVMVRHPMSADLRAAVAKATFPVVLPVGVPSGMRIVWFAYAPADRPTFFDVEYGDEKGNLRLGFSLFDSSTAGTEATIPPAGVGRPEFHAAYHWTVGRETVLVPKRPHASGAIDRVEAAMQRTSPAASLAAAQPALWTAIVIGGVYEPLAVAERLAPPPDRSVVLDNVHVRSVHALALAHRAILDTHTVSLTDIPQLNGAPDYAHATLQWPRTVAVSANGVRAIDAVLRFSRTPRDCRCGVLFDPSGGGTYRVWTVPLAAPLSAHEYRVDSATLAVHEAR